LAEDGALVPGYVFVVESVAADVHDGCEGDTDFFMRGRDAGYAVHGSRQMI